MSNIHRIIIQHNPLDTLRLCDGYYLCPKDANGKRLGPLVGYAGTYDDGSGLKKQWVGDIYCNFAKAERYAHVMCSYAVQLKKAAKPHLGEIDAFCGAPIGGYTTTDYLGLVCDRPIIKAEKKVLEPANEGRREKSKLVFGRHEVQKSERVAIVEDVCNNFSTTLELIQLIEKAGGKVVAIVCLLNRSLQFDKELPYNGVNLPIISLVRIPIPEYKQDDPAVADDIARGNIIWKPKDNWDQLAKAMAA